MIDYGNTNHTFPFTVAAHHQGETLKLSLLVANLNDLIPTFLIFIFLLVSSMQPSIMIATSYPIPKSTPLAHRNYQRTSEFPAPLQGGSPCVPPQINHRPQCVYQLLGKRKTWRYYECFWIGCSVWTKRGWIDWVKEKRNFEWFGNFPPWSLISADTIREVDSSFRQWPGTFCFIKGLADILWIFIIYGNEEDGNFLHGSHKDSCLLTLVFVFGPAWRKCDHDFWTRQFRNAIVRCTDRPNTRSSVTCHSKSVEYEAAPQGTYCSDSPVMHVAGN